MEPVETERLILRRYRPEDWMSLRDMISHDDVRRFEPHWDASDEACRTKAGQLAASEDFIAVELKDGGAMVGHVYFSRTSPEALRVWEMGYIFNPVHHHHGYATESCRAILNHAFSRLKAHRVVARCCPQNTASWRLMERLGMRREGHFRKAAAIVTTPEGEPIWWDEYVYAILGEDWPAR